jgi:hypothetical protein
MHIFECVYFSGGSIVYLKERHVNRDRCSRIEREGGRKVMDALLITLLLAIVLSVGGTIISQCLFAHGSHVSRPRSARRVYVAPRSYTTDTTISIEESETARYAHKAIATVVILLVTLSALIYSAFHALVVH